jgi:DNA-binding XRE family transcriptional regulator
MDTSLKNDSDLVPKHALQNLKEKFDFSNRDLAKMAGVHEKTIGTLLNGNQEPYSKTRHRNLMNNLADIFVDWGLALYGKNKQLNDLGVLVWAMKKYAEKGPKGFAHRHLKEVCSCSSKKQVLRPTKLQNGRVTRRVVKCLKCNRRHITFEIQAEDYFVALVEHETLESIQHQLKKILAATTKRTGELHG